MTLTACSSAHYDVIIIGTGAGGGHHGARAGGDRRAHPPRRARRLRAAGRRELGSGGGLEATCAIARPSAGSTPTAASSSPTCTTASAATPSSGAACSTGCAARTSRQIEHADGISPAWPIDYDTLAPYYDRAERLYQVHGQARHRSDRAAAPAVSLPARSRTRDGMAELVSSSCARAACTRRRCRSACIRPGEQGGCVLCNTCNSFPCRLHAKSEADVCCVRPALRHDERELWTNAFAQRLLTDARRHAGRRRGDRARRRGDARRGAAGRRVVRAPCNSAALLLRSASDRHPERPGELVGAGRPPLHGPPGHDDAGLPSVPARTTTVFQKTVAHQRLLLRRPRTCPTRSATSSRRAARTA